MGRTAGWRLGTRSQCSSLGTTEEWRIGPFISSLHSAFCCPESLLSPSGQLGHVGDPEMLGGRWNIPQGFLFAEVTSLDVLTLHLWDSLCMVAKRAVSRGAAVSGAKAPVPAVAAG